MADERSTVHLIEKHHGETLIDIEREKILTHPHQGVAPQLNLSCQNNDKHGETDGDCIMPQSMKSNWDDIDEDE